MRKNLPLLIILSFFSITACKKYSNTYMEKQAFDEKTGFRYFSKTVENSEQVFRLNDRFRQSRIGSEDRGKHPGYSKIYFDNEQFPKRIENYKKHQFNTHVYYPYRIFSIQKQEKQIQITVINQKWEKNKLVISQMRAKNYSKETERPLEDLIALLKKSPDNTSLIDKIFHITFIASNNKTNKQNQETLTIERNFVPIEGTSEDFPTYPVKIFFFDENRSTAGEISLGKKNYILGRLSKINGKEIGFVFIDFDRRRAERKKTASEKMEDSVYSGKK